MRACLVQGKQMPEGAVLITWPEDPPRGAGFLKSRDADDMVNGGHAVSITEEELTQFINSNLNDQ